MTTSTLINLSAGLVVASVKINPGRGNSLTTTVGGGNGVAVGVAVGVDVGVAVGVAVGVGVADGFVH